MILCVSSLHKDYTKKSLQAYGAAITVLDPIKWVIKLLLGKEKLIGWYIPYRADELAHNIRDWLIL